MNQTHVLVLKTLIHGLSLWLLASTYYRALTDQVAGDPVEAVLHFSGIGAFNLLLLSLCISPVARWTRQANLLKVRRLLGLYAFTYAAVHVLSYIFFELQLEWGLILSEIIERPYITVGMAAFVILLLLALTSTSRIRRRMGKRWQQLHNWVYLAAPLIALHFIWSVKSDLIEPLIYWLMVLALLAARRDSLRRWLTAHKKRKKNLA